jgi:hypothetical protein
MSSQIIRLKLLILSGKPTIEESFEGSFEWRRNSKGSETVRDVVMKICEASGMKEMGQEVPAGWGWRGEVASL